MIYETPADLFRLLDETVEAASRTTFFRAVLGGRPIISSVTDFERLPITPIADYRGQRLADVITDPAQVQWIAGAYGGQDGLTAPSAEGPADTAARYDVLRDALFATLPDRRPRMSAVVTSPRRRFFAAEVGAILGYHGIPSHLFIDRGTDRTYDYLSHAGPDVIVALADELDDSRLPDSVELCVTFRRRPLIQKRPRLDMYLVDELGFLGHSTDLRRWTMYNDLYYFEQADDGHLVVTAIRARVRPVLRLRLDDSVLDLGRHTTALERLSENG